MPGFRLNPATCDELVLREFFCEKYSLRISRNRIFIAKWCISSLEFRVLRGLLQILKFRIGFSLNKGKSSSKNFDDIFEEFLEVSAIAFVFTFLSQLS